MKIFIDPGHGGKDPGAIGQFNGETLNEADVNLKIAKEIERILSAEGHEARCHREGDTFVPLQEICNKANHSGADYFISIHCNSFHSPKAHGVETYHYPSSASGAALANPIQKSLVSAFPDQANRGVKEASFYVLANTAMPAVLVECAFISNAEEFLLLRDRSEDFATAIAEGILSAIQ